MRVSYVSKNNINSYAAPLGANRNSKTSTGVMERIPYRFCCSYYSLNHICCETFVHLNGSVRPLQEEVYDKPPNAVDGSGEMKIHALLKSGNQSKPWFSKN